MSIRQSLVSNKSKRSFDTASTSSSSSSSSVCSTVPADGAVPFGGEVTMNSEIPIAVHSFINHAIKHQMKLIQYIDIDDVNVKAYVNKSLRPKCLQNDEMIDFDLPSIHYKESEPNKLAAIFITSYLKELKNKIISDVALHFSGTLNDSKLEDFIAWKKPIEAIPSCAKIFAHFLFLFSLNSSDFATDESIIKLQNFFSLSSIPIAPFVFRKCIIDHRKIFLPHQIRCSKCFPAIKQFGLDLKLQKLINNSIVSHVLHRSFEYLIKSLPYLQISEFFDTAIQDNPNMINTIRENCHELTIKFDAHGDVDYNKETSTSSIEDENARRTVIKLIYYYIELLPKKIIKSDRDLEHELKLKSNSDPQALYLLGHTTIFLRILYSKFSKETDFARLITKFAVIFTAKTESLLHYNTRKMLNEAVINNNLNSLLQPYTKCEDCSYQ